MTTMKRTKVRMSIFYSACLSPCLLFPGPDEFRPLRLLVVAHVPEVHDAARNVRRDGGEVDVGNAALLAELPHNRRHLRVVRVIHPEMVMGADIRSGPKFLSLD